MTIALPQIQPFADGHIPDDGKKASLKVLEESAELVEAAKAYLKTTGTDDYVEAKNHVLEEFCDVLQALGNTAQLLGLTEQQLAQAYDQVVRKNTLRGRYDPGAN